MGVSDSRDRSDDDALRREVTGADGRRYRVDGTAKDWNLGTGSVTADLAQFVWALLRRARGKEWVVSVRPATAGAHPVTSRRVGTREEAVEAVEELVEAVESGRIFSVDDGS